MQRPHSVAENPCRSGCIFVVAVLSVYPDWMHLWLCRDRMFERKADADASREWFVHGHFYTRKVASNGNSGSVSPFSIRT